MCKHPLHPFLHALPKCEHHVHIEGTISPALLFSLSAKNAIPLPSDDAAFSSPETLQARYEGFTSLDDFLHYYFIGFSVLVQAEDFEALAYEYLVKARGQGVLHAEVFFDPQVHTRRGVPYHTVMAGLHAARRRAETRFPDLSVGFIPCLVRHLPLSLAHDMLREIAHAGHFDDGTVVGLGMSGTELGKHPELFGDVYREARDLGVTNLTAHYGEEGPAEYVQNALSLLHTQRIDHGRRSAEDPSLLHHLSRTQTLLTLCPISNLVLRGIPQMTDLPIRALLDAGVPFSINSDDPAYFGGYVLENYCAVQEAFGLDVDEWEGIARAGIQGSWCSVQRKGELLTELERVIVEWR
ncbi:Adenine deaminase [Cladobotryum mycophilum]|uniref:Adenine deaminase n=1 Tax=Cladobotryum mycophilum TaxID=491253 RepID=A0ABR0SV62_9HYPO